MEQALQYIAIFIGLVALVTLVGWLKKKVGFGERDKEKLKSILKTIEFIVQEFNIGNKGEVIHVIEACYEALDFINEIGEKDLYEKKKLIEGKAIEICLAKGVDLGDELVVEVVDRVSDYLIGQEFLVTIES